MNTKKCVSKSKKNEKEKRPNDEENVTLTTNSLFHGRIPIVRYHQVNRSQIKQILCLPIISSSFTFWS